MAFSIPKLLLLITQILLGLCLQYYEGTVFVVLELVLFTNMKCKHTKRYSVKLRSGYANGIGRNEFLPVHHSTDQFCLVDPTPKF